VKRHTDRLGETTRDPDVDSERDTPGRALGHGAPVSRPHFSLTATTKRAFPSRSTAPQLIALSNDSLVVRSRNLLQKGAEVGVTLWFQELDRSLEIEAQVVWTVESLGDMALRFSSLDDDGRDTIREYQTLRARHR
jgi:hypothetical protein